MTAVAAAENRGSGDAVARGRFLVLLWWETIGTEAKLDQQREVI